MPLVFWESASYPEAVLPAHVRCAGVGPPSAPVPIPVLNSPSVVLVSFEDGT